MDAADTSRLHDASRCMPLMMSIMDDLAKGKPVSMAYLELWCRTFDENFVVLSKPQNTAFHAGFGGQRGERTWRGRLTLLQKLYFIDLKAGPSGPASYALLYNPYKVIEWHRAQKTPGLREDKWNALVERAGEVGDESLTPVAAQPAPAQPTAPTPAAPQTTPAASS